MKFTQDKKAIAVFLREKKKMTLTSIARSLGVSHQLVSYHLRKPVGVKKTRPARSSSSIRSRRAVVESLVTRVTHVEGRRYTPKLKKLRIRRVIRRPFSSPSRIARELTRTGIPVSASTVRRDLHACGFSAFRKGCGPWLSQKHCDARVAFCRSFLSSRWSLVFSDEKYFSSDDFSDGWQWAKQKCDVDIRIREQDHYSVMVWACIGIGFRFIIVFTEKTTVNRSRYISDILTPALPSLHRQCKGSVYFQQDNARAHVDGISFLRSQDVQCIDGWPSRSPDMSPIETLWGMLTYRVGRRAPWGAEQLKKCVEEEFWAVDQKTIDDLVLGFRERCEECVKKKGGMISGGSKKGKQ